MTSPTGRINIEEPRYDQSTFSGRAKHFFITTNPLNLLASGKQLEEAKSTVEKYRKGDALPNMGEDQIWKAKQLYDSAYHPDTKEKMFILGRMSAQVPCNMVITGCMLTFYKTPKEVIFWQWLNQTFNAIVNYTNRSGESPVPVQQLGLSYVLATGGAVGTALSINSLVKRMPPLIGRFVPFTAVASANCINIPCMRSREVLQGIPIFDANGNRLGESKVAAKSAIAQVVFSRVMMATPGMSQKHLIERDGFVVTSPGRLLCQKIIHLKAKRGDQDWERMICRTLCEVENLGLNSVTFPALGTGGSGFSPDRMAKLMMSSFRHYVTSKNYRQCLKSIRIVIYETDMWKLFIDSVTEAPSRTPSVTSKVMGMFRPKKALVDSVKIDVYIDSASHLENVKMKLEELFTEHKIYPPKLSLEQLEDKEIKLIEHKGETCNISVELNHRSGYIKLQGYGNAMNEVQRDIESCLTTLEKDRLLKEASTSVTLPKCWSKMILKDPMKIEGLSALKMEYIAISNKFRSETGNRRQIIKIERIQNATLFTQYIAHKHQMEQMNKGSQYPVERCLWHGTSPGAIDSINKTGFNRNFNYGSSHGVGVYFAVNASTSQSYCKQDQNGHFHMYYAHLLTGDCCVGSHRLRNPPAKNSQQPWNTYDSTTDSTSSPNFFVIFHDARAYPSYYIEFV